MTANLTAIIKTFERPRALDRLIRSIRRDYPDLPIIVGDDSFHPYRRTDVEYLRLPPDIGASAGRNAMLHRVQTPLFLQLDDDFEFTEATNIERLVEVVESEQADLAGGDCIRCKKKLLGLITRRKAAPYHGYMQVDGERLTLTRSVAAEPVHLCDIIAQFFVARVDDVLDVGGWDAELKTEEHEEFFLRLCRHGLQPAFCPDVQLLHWNDRPRFYRRFRGRDYRPLAAERMGITSWTDFDGRTSTFPGEPLRGAA